MQGRGARIQAYPKENIMDKPEVAGIEVSAQSLLVAGTCQGQPQPLQSFANTAEGHRALGAYLRRLGGAVRVCLESTGLYGLDLALALHAQPGIAVMVANPRSVRHFAQALMKRSKTDPLDARLLQEYAARMPFHAWQPPPPSSRQLCAVVRHLHALTELCTMEKNRLHAASLSQTTPAMVRRELQRSLQFQQRAGQRLTREALRIVAHDGQLQRRFELLQSTPGIGQTSALQLLGELVLLGADLSVRQWVAYAGLDPRAYQSGSSVHKKARISKVGSRHLRRALFMPALVAVRHDPYFRAYYQHLLAAAKPKMLALTAVMRKLLHALYGMFKHDQVFAGPKVFALPSSPLPSQPHALASA
jgi:transposase